MNFCRNYLALVFVLLAAPAGISQTPSTSASQDYVQRIRIGSRLEAALTTLGDRLEKVGNERITLAGTLTRSAGTSQVRVIWQLPGLYRIEETKDAATRTITFDGTRLSVSSGTLTSGDADLIETVINNSAEHFFVGQSRGRPTRILGFYVRTDDGKAARYNGPWYDIYQVFESPAATSGRHRPKLYLLSSTSRLLDQVVYQEDRLGTPVRVVTQLAEWQTIGNQKVATTIVRQENGQTVLRLAYTSTVLSPKATDGVFTGTSAATTVAVREDSNAQ